MSSEDFHFAIDPALLTSAMAALEACHGQDVTFAAKENALVYSFVDNTHTMYIHNRIPISDESGTPIERFTVDVPAMKVAAKLFPKGEDISVTVSQDGRVTLKHGRLTRMVPTVAEGNSASPAPPKYQPDAWHQFNATTLAKIIKDTAPMYDALAFMYEGGACHIFAGNLGVNGSYRYDLDIITEHDTGYAKYSLDLLKKVVLNFTGLTDIEFNADPNKPLCVKAGDFVAMLAPRIDSE